MKTSSLLIFLGLSSVCIASVSVVPDPKTQAIQSQLDSFMANKAPGATVSVKAPGFEFTKSSGVFDQSTGQLLQPTDLVRIASVSKTFFGVLASILDVEGKINLDATLGQAFPQIASQFSVKRDPKTNELWDPTTITLREMLSHTAGIPDPLEGPDFLPYEVNQVIQGKALDVSLAVQEIFKMGLTYKPGTQEVYSNGGFILASYIVEQVTHRPYWMDMREKVLNPLGLNGTFNGAYEAYDLSRLAHGYDAMQLPGSTVTVTDWQTADQGNGFANGGLVSSVSDLAKFYRAIFKDPAFPVGIDKNEFLKTFLPNDSTNIVAGTRYADGIAQDEDGCYYHGGHFIGYVGDVMYCPDQDLSIVIEITTDVDPLADLKDTAMNAIKKLWIPNAKGSSGVGN